MSQPTQFKKASRNRATSKPIPYIAARGDRCDCEPAHATLDALQPLVWMADSACESGWGNSAWTDVTGIDSTDWLQAIHPDSVNSIRELWEAALAHGTHFQEELRLRTRSGDYRWFLVAALFRRSADQANGHWYLTATDIHERTLARQELHLSLSMREQMLNATVDCIQILRPDGTLAHMNLAGCRALGISPDSGFGMKWVELFPHEARLAGQRALRQALQGGTARFSCRSEFPGTAPQYRENTLSPIMDEDGQPICILCVSRDVTLQQQAEDRLRRAGEVDELTGLPNRRAFNEHLRPALGQARDNGSAALLMILNLDHFKYLNETLGHAAGDHLLQVLARRIQGCLPESAYIARVGGDEFAIVVQDIEGDEALQRTAARVMAQLDPPIHYAGKRINGGMSMGCALYPRDTRDPVVLMRQADIALNDMKACGRGGMRVYRANMMRPLEEAAAQLEHARRIVRDGSVKPYYQPKIRLHDRKLVGMEALLRSQNPEHGGLQMPAMVQAAFRDFDLSTRMAEALRTRIFSDIAQWLRAGLEVVPVSINASPVEFMRDNYAELLLGQLEKAAVAPHLIELEVTEHTLNERCADYVVRALTLLRREGIHVALDDFGTGHSSLTRLRNFPVDCLKIDAGFVNNFGTDPAVTAVVNAIGQIGSALSLELVAEGIETEQQCRALEAAGFSIGQGHLFSEAVSGDAIAARLLESMALA